MSFLTLSENEKIILLLRRHKFLLTANLFKPALLALTPFFLGSLLTLASTDLFDGPAASFLFWYFASLFWLAAWVWGVLIWLDWFLDVWIVTNERLIDIQQRHLFSRRIISCTLGKVQNVTADTAGLLATFFHFGNVDIKTADDRDHFLFHQIPSPTETQKTILAVHQEYLKNTPRATQSL